MNFRLHIIVLLLVCISHNAMGQIFIPLPQSDTIPGNHTLMPLNRNLYNAWDKELNELDNSFHTGFKPYLQSDVNKTVGREWGLLTDPTLKQRLFQGHLITVQKSGEYAFTLDPAIDFSIGKDLNNGRDLFTNTRGFRLTGNIGEQFSFATEYYENQAILPGYIDQFVRDSSVVPGQGRARRFKDDGWDYAMASAYISYKPSKYFDFQFGHGKHFIGDGYRSLLISDNAFNYPYLRINTTVWKIKYTNLWSQYLDIRERTSFSTGFPKKYSSIHYLSYDISRRWQVGLFEAIVWQAADSVAQRGFELQYLNPVIFYHPVQFSLGSPDNSLIGMNGKYKLSNYSHFYGQLVIDDFNFSEFKKGNGFYQQKYGLQFGFKKYFRLGKVFRNSFFQTEYNQVQPYTYAHKEIMQNYAHHNQALAHPLGANFRESVSYLSLRPPIRHKSSGNFRMYHYRFKLELKFMYAVYGADSLGSHFGKNIYISDIKIIGFPKTEGVSLGQGVKTNLTYKDVRLSYLINPRINLNFEVIFSDRILSSEFETKHSSFISIGLKTNLSNHYYDF